MYGIIIFFLKIFGFRNFFYIFYRGCWIELGFVFIISLFVFLLFSCFFRLFFLLFVFMIIVISKIFIRE